MCTNQLGDSCKEKGDEKETKGKEKIGESNPGATVYESMRTIMENMIEKFDTRFKKLNRNLKGEKDPA